MQQQETKMIQTQPNNLAEKIASMPITTMAFPDSINPHNIELPDVDLQLEDKEYMDLHQKIFKYRKPNRAQVLLDLQESQPMSSHHSDMLTLDVWQSTEFPHTDLDTWQQIWWNYLGLWQQEKLKSIFSNGPITVYRGGPKDGYSWTTNKDIAQWFAKIRGSMHTKGIIECMHPVEIGVWQKTIDIDDVHCMLEYEDEVVLTQDIAFEETE